MGGGRLGFMFLLLGLSACAAGGGDGGGGDGDACVAACDRFAACDPRLADDSCVSLCREQSNAGELTEACLRCRAEGPCGVIDGSDPSCDPQCGRDCGSDDDCLAETGQRCDVAEFECQLPCATDADCSGQLCCDDGDLRGCKDECWGSCTSDLVCDTEYGQACVDPEGDGSRVCACACDTVSGACDTLSAEQPGAPCPCDFDCG